MPVRESWPGKASPDQPDGPGLLAGSSDCFCSDHPSDWPVEVNMSAGRQIAGSPARASPTERPQGCGCGGRGGGGVATQQQPPPLPFSPPPPLPPPPPQPLPLQPPSPHPLPPLPPPPPPPLPPLQPYPGRHASGGLTTGWRLQGRGGAEEGAWAGCGSGRRRCRQRTRRTAPRRWRTAGPAASRIRVGAGAGAR